MNTQLIETKPRNSLPYIIGGIAAILIIIIAIYLTRSNKTLSDAGTEPVTEVSTSAATMRPYGVVTLRLGETAHFRGISITPLRIEEDSRCAKNVQCVWAGTVKISVRSDLSSGQSPENMITLGQKTTVDTFSIGLNSVAPDALGTKIANSDYLLTLEVHQSVVKDDELIGK